MYSLIANSKSILREDGAVIPPDPKNTDYQNYQDWVKAGNVATQPAVSLVTNVFATNTTLEQAQDSQVATLNASCQASIYAGFQSSASGTSYTYPMQQTDQLNLGRALNVANMLANAPLWVAGTDHKIGDSVTAVGQVFTCVKPGISGLTAPAWNVFAGVSTTDGTCQWKIWTTMIWCMDSTGKWLYMSHTLPEVKQVGMDAHHFISTLQLQNAGLQAQVRAATTVAEVQAITWPSA